MKRMVLALFVGAVVTACQENESISIDTTGNELTYPLQQASEYEISGTVSIKEKCDGSSIVTVSLTGTEGDIEHPVHLHLGNISEPGADVVALLNPVLGSTGRSETLLKQLSDETSITYRQLIDLNACIKVHLAASGQDRDIVLAGGNIGAATSDIAGGRAAVGLCKSE
ncbi:MAG TPA: hypothetical protein VK589_07825 [Chryseolinea sp.]|nr:hypothetical protein [Chryseolinea sp.]